MNYLKTYNSGNKKQATKYRKDGIDSSKAVDAEYEEINERENKS